jgi:hypothetical protein
MNKDGILFNPLGNFEGSISHFLFWTMNNELVLFALERKINDVKNVV